MRDKRVSPVKFLVIGTGISLFLAFMFYACQFFTGSNDISISMVKSPELGVPQSNSCSGKADDSAQKNASGEEMFINGMGMKFVRLPDLEIAFGIHEVTREQFRFFAESVGLKELNWLNRITRAGLSQEDNHPVVNVNWEEAARFCEWLTKQEGIVFRLPTDYEWSLAAGLGPETSFLSPSQRSEKASREFFWGDNWPIDKPFENYADKSNESMTGGSDCFDFDDGFPVTSPVGSFPPNQLGIYDMGGNVSEWVYDWYQDIDDFKAVRGASFGSGKSHKEAHYKGFRSMGAPTFRSENFGFRIVAEISEKLPVSTAAEARPAPVVVASIPAPVIAEAIPAYDSTPIPGREDISSYPAFAIEKPILAPVTETYASEEAPLEMPTDQTKPIRVTYSGKDGINLREDRTFDSDSILGAIMKQSTAPLLQIGEDTRVDTETWVNVEVKGWIPTKNSTHTYLKDQGDGTWKVVWSKPGDRWVAMRSTTSSDDTLISKVFYGTVVKETDAKKEGSNHYIYGKFSGWAVKENASRSYISDIK